MSRSLVAGVVLASLLATACHKDAPAESSSAPATSVAAANITTPTTTESVAHAAVGKAAPDFALKDLDGKEVRLSSFKGKTVVLEWFNPSCPFVNKAHTVGSLKGEADKLTKSGVVWLAINSGGAGKQGNGALANRDGAKTFAMNYPILLDEAGSVGKMYGATNTPNMFVIDGKGTLVYRGAIDNSPDGEGASPTGGKLVSYVDEAVAAIAAGKAPATTETKAYGCSVKYASN
jgi:peroxiredoxin